MNADSLDQTARRIAAQRLSRRTALASAAAGVGAAMLGRPERTPAALAQEATPAASPVAGVGNNRPPNVPVWMQTPGAPSSPYGERAAAEASIVRLAPNPVVSFSPLAEIKGTLTPNALFYEIHFGGIPAIDPTQHRLLVHGLVDRPTLFTMDDLKRFPAVSVTHFLECAGNSFSEWTEAPMAPSVQLSHGWDQ
jgi:sulfane dehydrogenase subunit SoxC